MVCYMFRITVHHFFEFAPKLHRKSEKNLIDIIIFFQFKQFGYIHTIIFIFNFNSNNINARKLVAEVFYL